MIKSEFELEQMAEGFVKRDNTRAEKLLGKVKLSLTTRQADGLIKVCKECYTEGAKDMAEAYEKDRKEYQNGLVKDVSRYASDIINVYSKELTRNRVITAVSMCLFFFTMIGTILMKV